MKHFHRILAIPLLLVSVARGATPEQDAQFAARDAERYFERAGLLVDHPDATAYLQRILQRLVDASPHTALTGCRIHILRGARPSVFALPNCRVYVSTAMFLALENEAQIAAAVARELAHVQLGSVAVSRRNLERQMNAANFFFMAVVAASGAGAYHTEKWQTPMTDAVGDLIWRVSVRGFSEEIELRADREGLGRFEAAGYLRADSRRTLERLRAVVPELSEAELKVAPLLGSRPVLDARLGRLQSFGVASAEGATSASPEHALLASGLRLEQVKELIRTGDCAAARQLLAEQVGASGENGMTHFLTGELARIEGPKSQMAALESFQKGASFDDAPAQLFLNLGLLLRESGQHDAARPAFERFLELEPGSADAAVVRHYLRKASGS